METKNIEENDNTSTKKSRRGRPKGSKNKKTLEKSCDIKNDSSVKDWKVECLSDVNNPELLRNSILELLKGELFGGQVTKIDPSCHSFITNNITSPSLINFSQKLSDQHSQSKNSKNSIFLSFQSDKKITVSTQINTIQKSNQLVHCDTSINNLKNQNNFIDSSKLTTAFHLNENKVLKKGDNLTSFEVDQLSLMQNEVSIMNQTNFNKSSNILNVPRSELLCKNYHSNCISDNGKSIILPSLNLENSTKNKNRLIYFDNHIDFNENNINNSGIKKTTKYGRESISNCLNNNSSSAKNSPLIKFNENPSIDFNNSANDYTLIKPYTVNDGNKSSMNIKITEINETKNYQQNEYYYISQQLPLHSNNSFMDCYNIKNMNFSSDCKSLDAPNKNKWLVNSNSNASFSSHVSSLTRQSILDTKIIDKRSKKNKANLYSKITDPCQEMHYKEKLCFLNNEFKDLIISENDCSFVNHSCSIPDNNLPTQDYQILGNIFKKDDNLKLTYNLTCKPFDKKRVKVTPHRKMREILKHSATNIQRSRNKLKLMKSTKKKKVPTATLR